MIKLNNVFLTETETELDVLKKLKGGDFGYYFMNDAVIAISYPNYMFTTLNDIVKAYSVGFYNDYNLTKEEINTLKLILIKLNKLNEGDNNE